LRRVIGRATPRKENITEAISARLRLALLGLQCQAGDCIALEDLDGAGHLADFVGAPDAGHLDVQLAGGELVHRDRHAPQRPGDALRHEDRYRERKQQHQSCNRQRSLRRHPGLRVEVIDIDAGADHPIPRRKPDYIGQFRLRLVGRP